jgi:hypothetical protein
MDRRGAPRVGGTGDAVDREMEVSFAIPCCYITLGINIISSNS